MFNTIILHHGETECSERNWLMRVQPGDSIWGVDSDAKEIKRWPIDKKDEALAELAKYRCKYTPVRGFSCRLIELDEYALEYCECDDDGEFITGSDFVLAEEEKRIADDDEDDE